MRLAIVVQRYGNTVIGGAETHSRLLAERFAEQHDVMVLTTRAMDYQTWANTFPGGPQVEGRVKLIRFPVVRKRNWRYFGWKSKRLFSSRHSLLDEYRWIVDQGPECPELVEYIKAHSADFDICTIRHSLAYRWSLKNRC